MRIVVFSDLIFFPPHLIINLNFFFSSAIYEQQKYFTLHNKCIIRSLKCFSWEVYIVSCGKKIKCLFMRLKVSLETYHNHIVTFFCNLTVSLFWRPSESISWICYETLILVFSYIINTYSNPLSMVFTTNFIITLQEEIYFLFSILKKLLQLCSKVTFTIHFKSIISDFKNPIIVHLHLP